MLRQIQYNLSKLFNFPFNVEEDDRVQRMSAEIKNLNGLKFVIKVNNDGWIAECENIKGIITGGTSSNPTQKEIDDMVKDAVYTAFDIPPHLCKDGMIKNTKEPVKEAIYV